MAKITHWYEYRAKKESKKWFQKRFFQVEAIFIKTMNNNAIFIKFINNVRNHSDIKLTKSKSRSNYLVLESNYHTTIFFSKNLLATEMKKKTVHE